MWNFKLIALLLLPIVVDGSLRIQRLRLDPNEIKPVEIDPNVAEICEQGQYYDISLNHCFNCTLCSDFMYELETCSKTQNTVCGWCGNKVDVDQMPDSVLVSYQNKCLMSNLEFVDMRKLENQLDDSGNWLDSEEDSFEKSDEEDDDDEDMKSLEEDKTFDDNLEKELAKIFKTRKSQNKQLLGDRYDPIFPHEKDFKSEILTKEEVFKTLKKESHIPNENFFASNENEYDDSDEENSNERLIKWDKWVDDRVKPIIAQRIEKMRKLNKAEQIQSAEEIDVSEVSLLIVEAEEPIEKTEDQEVKIDRTMLIVRVGCIFIIFLLISHILVVICRRKPNFRVLDVNAEEYKIIQKCGENAERANNADKHVHENPLCLP